LKTFTGISTPVNLRSTLYDSGTNFQITDLHDEYIFYIHKPPFLTRVGRIKKWW